MPIVGERVACPITIGIKGPFTGVIESKSSGGREFPVEYNVRADDDGQLWARTVHQLRRFDHDGSSNTLRF